MPAEEDRRGQDQDGEIHQQRGIQRHHRIHQIVAAGAALAGIGVADLAGLHQRRMQVEIVRHHGGAQHADGDVQALVVDARNHAQQHLRRHRLGQTISMQKQVAMTAMSARIKAST
jgi:hypothetical protein